MLSPSGGFGGFEDRCAHQFRHASVVLTRVRRGSAARHRSAADLQVIVPTAGERERWR
jgi:hypothetical protein